MNFIDKKLDFSKHIINGLTSELKGYYLYKKYASCTIGDLAFSS